MHVCNRLCGGGAGLGADSGSLHAIEGLAEVSDLAVIGKVAGGLAANEGLGFKGYSLVPMPDGLNVGMVTRFGPVRQRYIVWGELK